MNLTASRALHTRYPFVVQRRTVIEAARLARRSPVSAASYCVRAIVKLRPSSKPPAPSGLLSRIGWAARSFLPLAEPLRSARCTLKAGSRWLITTVAHLFCFGVTFWKTICLLFCLSRANLPRGGFRRPVPPALEIRFHTSLPRNVIRNTSGNFGALGVLAAAPFFLFALFAPLRLKSS